MSILDILTYPDPRLREKCTPVTNIDHKIKELLDQMAETMYAAPGIGLAAPQVGSLKRVIVVDVGEDEDVERAERKPKLYKIINPEIVERAGSTETEEGCLSIPDIREYVKRSAQVVITGLDPSGKKLELEADGLLAICLQHEIDHLDGVLFIDHLSKLKRELVKAELKKQLTSEKSPKESGRDKAKDNL